MNNKGAAVVERICDITCIFILPPFFPPELETLTHAILLTHLYPLQTELHLRNVILL